jgi:hypothetical protein
MSSVPVATSNNTTSSLEACKENLITRRPNGKRKKEKERAHRRMAKVFEVLFPGHVLESMVRQHLLALRSNGTPLPPEQELLLVQWQAAVHASLATHNELVLRNLRFVEKLRETHASCNELQDLLLQQTRTLQTVLQENEQCQQQIRQDRRQQTRHKRVITFLKELQKLK